MRFLGDENDGEKLLMRTRLLVSHWPDADTAEEVIAEMKIRVSD